MSALSEEHQRRLSVLAAMNLKAAKTELANKVYEACGLLEDLEFMGSFQGNAHHARQQIAEFATQLLAKAWVSEDPLDHIIDLVEENR